MAYITYLKYKMLNTPGMLVSRIFVAFQPQPQAIWVKYKRIAWIVLNNFNAPLGSDSHVLSRNGICVCTLLKQIHKTAIFLIDVCMPDAHR